MSEALLFQPFALRNTEVRNRLWVAPMCQYAVHDRDGVARAWHQQHIGALARGGAGVVMVEATAVVPEGRISPNDLGLWNAAQTAAFQELADAAHMHGARIGVQLAHAGRKASTYPWLPGAPEGTVPVAEGGWETVAPSAVAFGNFKQPRALTTAEIAATVGAFADAADRAVGAGFDILEIHAAHGYLLHEFLSPLSNLREDEYGGELRNRARFLLETVAAIRARHSEIPIVVRISASEWVPGGFDVDEATVVASLLAESGADMIDVSSGGNTTHAAIPVGPSYQVALAQRIRESSLPVGAVGLITSAAQAEGILATGQADVVSLGRPLLGNPHLPLSWAKELRADISTLTPPSYWRGQF